MNPSYDDLQDQLVEWLRPMRSTIPDTSTDEFEKKLSIKIEHIIPDDRVTRLIVALSNQSLCMSKDPVPYIDATDIIADNIYRNLYSFAWEWYREIKSQEKQQ